jgi:hypothetical protein
MRALRDGQIARFGQACAECPLAARCTTSTTGRTIHVGPTRRSNLARLAVLALTRNGPSGARQGIRTGWRVAAGVMVAV